jgi:hypothetical protein
MIESSLALQKWFDTIRLPLHVKDLFWKKICGLAILDIIVWSRMVENQRLHSHKDFVTKSDAFRATGTL